MVDISRAMPTSATRCSNDRKMPLGGHRSRVGTWSSTDCATEMTPTESQQRREAASLDGGYQVRDGGHLVDIILAMSTNGIL